MEKCSLQAASLCVERLLKAWPTPINQDPSAWAKECIARFSNYSEAAVQNITTKAIDRFKRLPPISAIVDLLKGEAAHENVINYSRERDRVVVDIDLQSDTEIVDQLVRRAFRNDPWPVIESERGKRLVDTAARAFLQEMNPKNDAHRMGFFMLRNRGFVPMTVPLDAS